MVDFAAKLRDAKAHAVRTHARLAPSGSDIWLHCPGAILLIEELGGVPDDSSEPAERGTAAHELLEASLKSCKTPEHYRKKTFNKTFVADSHMIDGVTVAWDYIKESGADEAEGEMALHIPATGEGGHTDALLYYRKSETLEIVDYKNGVGLVEAKDNSQMRLYALGGVEYWRLMHDWPVKKIKTTIIQPNAFHPDGPIRSEEMPLAKLLTWEKGVKAIVASINDGTAKRYAGPQCKWCKARARCPTLADAAAKEMGLEFKDFVKAPPVKSPKAVASMTNEALGKVWQGLDVVETWVKAVRSRVFTMLNEKPDSIPGLKLVEGKANRKWIDPAKTEEAFKRLGFKPDQYAPRSLVGIGDAEKLLGAKKAREIMPKLAAKGKAPLLPAPASDPRPAAVGTAEADFDEHLL